VARRSSERFTTIRTEGGLLPAGLLRRLVEGDRNLEGLGEAHYHLVDERLHEAIARSWARLTSIWSTFEAALVKVPDEDPAIGLTRERWLLPLFQELGYGRLPGARSIDVDGKSYPISHAWQHLPIHLVGWNVDLDSKTAGVAGAARVSPHGLVQEVLNRSRSHLWGVVSNGRIVRLLRDSVSLTRQAYIEFDLDAMFRGEVYRDFVVLWCLIHQSRVEHEQPERCWLEQWAQEAHKQGARVLEQLREGVESAIETLGRGFLAHRANEPLREALRAGRLDGLGYYRQLLRLVYRLLFLFVAEDRELLLDPGASKEAHERFVRYYSTARLRALAGRHRGTPHADLWRTLALVMSKLGEDSGCADLGLPALGSFLWSPAATPDLNGCELSNQDLLATIRALAYSDDDHLRLPVDYKNLGPEELGSVYEALLELHPKLNTESATFQLTTAGGHERKTTGSYYTPRPLIQALLDSALDPVLDATARARDPEAAILALKVCDPACGSGHFLIAAAHRIARRLAAVRTGDEEPSPEALRRALRDVIGRCIYGVDVNEMAVELCKVALWMEALEQGRPLSFLDHRIACGNSLLGTTPALLARGIPDDAFAPIEGDDRTVATEWRKRNRREREGQMELPMVAEPHTPYGELGAGFAQLSAMDDETIDGLHDRERRHRDLLASSAYTRATLLADAWCAAFVWRKAAAAPTPVTEDVLRLLESDPRRVTVETIAEIKRLATEYRFLHWHLAFPDVFQLPQRGAQPESAQNGWSGGFDTILGNPPWEAEELVEKEYFSASCPEIATVRTKSKRAELIARLRVTNPALFAEWNNLKRSFAGRTHLLKASVRFPLGSSGKLNTYRLFAELGAQLSSRSGRLGQVLKSGIITAQDSQPLFSSWSNDRRVQSAFDFINTQPIFPDVVANERFCLLTLTGSDRPCDSSRYAFGLTRLEDMSDPSRVFAVTRDELAELNPIDLSVPPASSGADYRLILLIHRAARPLRSGAGDGDPRKVHYTQGHLNSASDSPLFADNTLEQLIAKGAKLGPNETFRLGDEVWIPLYEGKYIGQLNHRFGTFQGVDASRRFGVKAEARLCTVEELGEPGFEVQPRYWLSDDHARLAYSAKGTNLEWLFVFRDVCRAIVDARTVQACIMPRRPCLDGLPLIVFDGERSSAARTALFLNALWGSFMFDYVARQKIHGAHLTKMIAYQLPIPVPSQLKEPLAQGTYWSFLEKRALELTVVTSSLRDFARDCGYEGSPFRWDVERRFLLRSELDAAFFHLYRVARSDVEFVMKSFPIVQRRDEELYGEYRTKRIILDMYDAMQTAIDTGTPYQTVLDPPPADPRVAHPSKS